MSLHNAVDSEIFVSILFSGITLKENVKNLRLRQDLPISIKDRVILPFRENKVLAEISEFTVLLNI